MSPGVWLSYRCCRRYRDVEARLFARGLSVTSETIRKGCLPCGQPYAHQLRHRRPQRGDRWHRDEGFWAIPGARHSLWRAVDQHGHVRDLLVQQRREKNAAKKCCRTRLKGCRDVPRVIVTDHLKSSGVATREMWPSVEHRQRRYRNHRAENAHQPTRQRERRMQGCKSAGHAQRFLAAYGLIAQAFRPRRPLLPGLIDREEMRQRFQSWQEVTSMAAAAYAAFVMKPCTTPPSTHAGRQ
jgi:putative transposase